jgi:hypothetical protein
MTGSLFKSNPSVDFEFSIDNSHGKKNTMLIFNLKNDFFETEMKNLITDILIIHHPEKSFIVDTIEENENEIEIISEDSEIEIAIGRCHIRIFLEKLSKTNIAFAKGLKKAIDKKYSITKVEFLDW